MFRFFRKHRTVVMVALVAVMAGMILFGLGGTSMMSSPQDAVIKVNGEKLSQLQYDRIYNQLIRQKTDAITPDQRKQMTGQAFSEMIRGEVFSQEAKKFGLEVSDQELQMNVASIPAFQHEGKFDPRTYVQVIGQIFHETPREFEKNHKKEMLGRKLNQLVATSIQLPDDVLEGSLAEQLKTETDKTKLKELKSDPEKFRGELREKELNFAFNDWLSQLNANLKVTFVSDVFRKHLENPTQ